MDKLFESLDLGDDPALKAQAEQIWGALDDMAKGDPKAYKAFIERQMKEAEAAKSNSKRSFTPEAGWCIRSTAVPLDARRSARPIFLNLCHHPVLEPPKDGDTPVVDRDGNVNAKLAMQVNSLSVPLTVGPPRVVSVRGLAKPKKKVVDADVVDVIFHPWTLEYAEKDVAFKRNLQDLAVHWGGQENNWVVSPEYVEHDSKYMGGTRSVDGSVLCEPYEVTAEDINRARGEEGGGGAAAAAPKPAPSEAPAEPVLPHHAIAATSEPEIDLVMPGSKPAAGKAGAKSVLIEEVCTSPSAPPSLPVPTVDVIASPDSYMVTIALPGLQSMADVELDVEATTLSLAAPGFQRVVEALPGPVHHQTASAKFKRRRGVVIVTVPRV